MRRAFFSVKLLLFFLFLFMVLWTLGPLDLGTSDLLLAFGWNIASALKMLNVEDTKIEPSTSPHKLNLLNELQNMRTDLLELLEDPEDVNTEVLPLNLLDNLKKKLE